MGGRSLIRKGVTLALSAGILGSPSAIALAKPTSKSASKSQIAAPANNDSAPMNYATEPADRAPSVVTAYEQKLFFKTFAGTDLSQRVDRIEKQIFGQIVEAPLPQRIERLNQIYQEQVAEEQKKQAEQAALQPRQPAVSPRSQQTTGGGALPGTNEYALERARVSIQAAREQEISGLLADGVNLYRAKQGAQAQEKFEQVLRLDPQNAQAYFNLGIIEESRGNYISALGNYKQAAKDEPDNKDYIDAVSATEKKATTQERVTGKKMELKGLADEANNAWRRGEFMSALDLYQQLDQKEPNKALVKYNIGSIYLMLKDQHNALQYYKQAHKLAPTETKYAEAYERLATELERVQKEQDAINKQAVANFNQSQLPPALPVSKKQKQAKKKNAGLPLSPFTPFVGAAPQNMPARGRTSFGVNPAMMNQFQSSNQAPGGILPPQGALNMGAYGFNGKSARDSVVVTSIVPNSRAAGAGLVAGDQIKTVDGVEVSSTDAVNQVLSQKKSLDHFPLVIIRGGNLGVVNF